MESRCRISGLTPARCRTSSTPSTSASRTLHPLVARGRQVLADVVGADRQLAVAAVDQHGEPHGAGPAEVGERVERGADRCGRRTARRRRGRRPCRRCRRPGCRSCAMRAGRLPAQVVAVHRDVERADRRPRRPRPRRSPAASRRASGDAAGGDAEQHQAVGALVALEDLVGDAAQGPGDVALAHDARAASLGDARAICRRTGRVHSGQGRPSAAGPPSPPHRTVVKGCSESRARQGADRAGRDGPRTVRPAVRRWSP